MRYPEFGTVPPQQQLGALQWATCFIDRKHAAIRRTSKSPLAMYLTAAWKGVILGAWCNRYGNTSGFNAGIAWIFAEKSCLSDSQGYGAFFSSKVTTVARNQRSPPKPCARASFCRSSVFRAPRKPELMTQGSLQTMPQALLLSLLPNLQWPLPPQYRRQQSSQQHS